MHRVHYFDTSTQAHDACLDEHTPIPEGDVVAVLAEGVVGLASTHPIAVTAIAGSLHTFPVMERAILLGELVHDEDQLAEAVDEALRHRFAVAPHFRCFARSRRSVPAQDVDIVVGLDDLLVLADAVDHRVAALTARLDTLDPDTSEALFVARGIERLRDARDRLAHYNRAPVGPTSPKEAIPCRA